MAQIAGMCLQLTTSDGRQVKGSMTMAGREHWIELLGFNFPGLEYTPNPARTPPVEVGGGSLSFEKMVDQATTALMAATQPDASTRKPVKFRSAVFELIPGTFRLSSGKSVPLFRLSAKDVRVLSVEVSVRETARGVDIVEKVEMSYRALGMAVSYPSDSDVTASREDCQVTSAEDS